MRPVEKFQPGCIDYAEDAVVVDLVKAGKRQSVVARVIEKRLRDALAEKDPRGSLRR
ncbi:hypothetical protein [Pyrodictium abyssi]|uniref:Uncharacterized protein n=1 Tax=Pyrodictium abyssi TaxID=54256 RepID=A0ABM8IW23_9CREN|nr:hypothetical protein PABY_13090 [Pyrodictium abyssi]